MYSQISTCLKDFRWSRDLNPCRAFCNQSPNSYSSLTFLLQKWAVLFPQHLNLSRIVGESCVSVSLRKWARTFRAVHLPELQYYTMNKIIRTWHGGRLLMTSSVWARNIKTEPVRNLRKKFRLCVQIQVPSGACLNQFFFSLGAIAP